MSNSSYHGPPWNPKRRDFLGALGMTSMGMILVGGTACAGGSNEEAVQSLDGAGFELLKDKDYWNQTKNLFDDSEGNIVS